MIDNVGYPSHLQELLCVWLPQIHLATACLRVTLYIRLVFGALDVHLSMQEVFKEVILIADLKVLAHPALIVVKNAIKLRHVRIALFAEPIRYFVLILVLALVALSLL